MTHINSKIFPDLPADSLVEHIQLETFTTSEEAGYIETHVTFNDQRQDSVHIRCKLYRAPTKALALSNSERQGLTGSYYDR